jgi:hypothetical protein
MLNSTYSTPPIEGANKVQGSGAATLGLPLGTHGNYYTNFILPLEFTYDAAADTNGTTLEALLEGCGLVSGLTGNGITLDLNFNGIARIFDMFDRSYETDGIGGVITCDTFLKDAIRIMGQLHGDKLSSK